MPKDDMCECMGWGRYPEPFLHDHHRRCSNFKGEATMLNLIQRLCLGMECWASDEDGIHPDAFEAYMEAKNRMGYKATENEDGDLYYETTVIADA